jgi:hypothetical protein
VPKVITVAPAVRLGLEAVGAGVGEALWAVLPAHKRIACVAWGAGGVAKLARPLPAVRAACEGGSGTPPVAPFEKACAIGESCLEKAALWTWGCGTDGQIPVLSID